MEPESDELFASIIDYTSGGAPYGITWAEQEAIERRAVAKNSSPPPKQKEPVSLNDIVQEMQIISDANMVYFQRSSGRFILISDEYIWAAESDAPLDDRPEWEQEIIRETADFLYREDDGDDVPLPTRYDIHEYDIMTRFCSTVENRKIANDLFNSITGKKAFRRFKEALKRHGIEKAGTHTGMRPTKKLPGNGAKITRLAGGNDMFSVFKSRTKNLEMALSMAELKQKIDVSGIDFPLGLSGKGGAYPDRTVICHPVRVGGETVAGLFMFCPEEDMDYFKVRIPPPEPGIKFRFLEYEFFR